MLKVFNKKKSATILSLGILTLLAGCGSNGFLSDFIVHNFSYVEFDRKSLLENVGKNVIIPEYSKFADSTSNLNLKIKDLVNTPNATKLSQAQQAWKDSMAEWQKTETFQFGPVKDLDLGSKIYFWPVRPDDIKSVLAKDKSVVVNNYLNTVGVTRKGLGVIEYLLFDATNGNQVILDSLTTGAGIDTKKQYLQLLGQDLDNNAQQVNNAWNTSQGNYLSKLTQDSTAFNMLLNNMIAVVEDVKDTKIAIPLGKKSGGESRPAEVESFSSNNSKDNMINNLQSLKILFNGADSDNAANKGLDNYLEYLEQKTLRDQINSQIDKSVLAIKDIDGTLAAAVDKEPQKVDNAYTQLTELLRLIKVDLANAVNETVHFNSTDGD